MLQSRWCYYSICSDGTFFDHETIQAGEDIGARVYEVVGKQRSPNPCLNIMNKCRGEEMLRDVYTLFPSFGEYRHFLDLCAIESRA